MPERRMFSSLSQVEAYLNRQDRRRTDFYTLERIQAAMARLHHPERKYKVIHVTGTSGKGSTCQMMYAMLRAAGYRVGMFTSPHLVRLNERIVTNGRPISDATWLRLMNTLWPQFEDLHLTTFEWITVLAFVYFAERQVEYAVIEVGMGGRLDATNVVQPAVAIVTEIDLDHTEQLGRTRRQIARKKEAIIKSGCIGLTGSRYVRRGRYINLDQARSIQSSLTGTLFDYKQYRRLHLGLIGKHQVRNAILAIEAAQALDISERAIRTGLRTAHHAGRFDIIQRRPLIIADGAHNPHKMKAFMGSLVELVQRTTTSKVIALMAIKYTKDLAGTLHHVLPFVDHVIITKFSESAPPQQLRQLIRQLQPQVTTEIQPNIRRAYARLRSNLQRNDIGIVTGSLYMIGDLYSVL